MGFRTSQESYFPGYFWAFISYFGNIGVLLFFVISGFVIEYTTQEKYSLGEAKKYLAKRFIRIYPIYLIALLIGVVLSKDPNDSWQRFLGNLLFLQTWVVDCFGNNGLLWTLHLEAAFYLLYLIVWKFKPKTKYLLLFSFFCALWSPFIENHLIRIFGYFYIWLLGLQLAKEYIYKKETQISNSSEWKWFWAALFASVAYTNINIIEVSIQKYWIYGKGYLSLVSVAVISGCLAVILAVPLGIKLNKYYKISILVSFLASFGAVAHSIIYQRWSKFSAYPLATAYLLLAILGFLLFTNKKIKSFLEKTAWLGKISYALYIIQYPIYIFIFSKIPSGKSVAFWWFINCFVFFIIFYLAFFLEVKLQPIVSTKLKKMLIKPK